MALFRSNLFFSIEVVIDKIALYLSDKYKDTDGVIASKKMFDVCGVKYRQIELAENIIAN